MIHNEFINLVFIFRQTFLQPLSLEMDIAANLKKSRQILLNSIPIKLPLRDCTYLLICSNYTKINLCVIKHQPTKHIYLSTYHSYRERKIVFIFIRNLRFKFNFSKCPRVPEQHHNKSHVYRSFHFAHFLLLNTFNYLIQL